MTASGWRHLLHFSNELNECVNPWDCDIMKTVVFCHGMPGSKADADLLRTANPDIKIIALDLLELDPAQMDTELQNSLEAALKQTNCEQVHVVGFSIGAMAAIKLAALCPSLVSRLTLISPAAPLSLGEFLPNMAGKPVFDLAMKYPRLLVFLTRFQGLIARVSPNTLINMLFAKCGPMEKALLKDPLFRNVMAKALSVSLVQRPVTYISYVKAYVTDWSYILPSVECPVDLWHGTNDTWSPPEMSAKLEGAFGKRATLNLIKDAEHYSMLLRVLL